MKLKKILLIASLSLTAVSPALASEPSAHGRVYPERNDDLAWENDIVGFRAYGPRTQKNGEKSYGYDIFFKYPGKGLVLEELYASQTSSRNWATVDSLRKVDPAQAREFERSFTYHIDHGRGMDCYAVGATLGCGAPAVLTADSICYPWCYNDVEIIENGPDRFEAHISFEPKCICGDSITERRSIVLDKGYHLNYSEVTYEGMTHPLTVVAGFPRRNNPPTYASAQEGIVAMADPTQGDSNGKALLGLCCLNPVKSVVEKDGHTLAVVELKPGEKLRYYWGFAWDRTDIRSMDAWVEYLRNFKAKNVKLH